MRYLPAIVILLLTVSSCNNADDKGKFTVTGELKNANGQKIYLEELFFSQKDPEVLDTSVVVNGRFSLTSIAPEQGLYRIRVEKGNMGFIFINDKPVIPFSADANDLSLNGPSFESPANKSLKRFIIAMDSQRTILSALSTKLEALKTEKGSDSALTAGSKNFENINNNYKNFIIGYIDTTSNPVMALFALGYTRNIDPMLLQKPVAGMSSRFPEHQAIATIVSQYGQMMAKLNQQAAGTGAEDPKKGTAQEAGMAPEITMNDVNDKPFSLSSLRGKYVLVDFWASWCGPCRGENPNVVAAWNKYKDKKFTVLGVSLDDNKEAWLKAIADDKLTWTHISDLKKWNSAVVGMYGITGIPYNVLVDPQGKIIATGLREDALQNKLAEVLK